jgi:hypothetical protein
MTTIQLDILEEYALEIIRVPEKPRAVEVIVESEVQEKPAPEKWGGIIKNPSGPNYKFRCIKSKLLWFLARRENRSAALAA